jgi:hypothetical protein
MAQKTSLTSKSICVRPLTSFGRLVETGRVIAAFTEGSRRELPTQRLDYRTPV